MRTKTTYAEAIRDAVQAEARIKRQQEADRLYRQTGKEVCMDCNGVDGHFVECPKAHAVRFVAQD